MIGRRQSIMLFAGAVVGWPRVGFGQTVPRRPLIGWLGGATPQTGAPSVDAFLRGMRDHGYVEGRDFNLAYRFAHGDFTRYPALAHELVDIRADVILAISAPIARQATSTIPIVSATLPADAIGKDWF